MILRENYSSTDEEREYAYHVNLICDAGFMTQISNSGFRMTNQGHDYLDAIRSDTIWARQKRVPQNLVGQRWV